MQSIVSALIITHAAPPPPSIPTPIPACFSPLHVSALILSSKKTHQRGSVHFCRRARQRTPVPRSGQLVRSRYAHQYAHLLYETCRRVDKTARANTRACPSLLWACALLKRDAQLNLSHSDPSAVEPNNFISTTISSRLHDSGSIFWVLNT